MGRTEQEFLISDSMSYRNLLLEIKDRILFVTINRESKMNALNRETLREILSVIMDASGNKAVGGIVITGSGHKSFIAGADIAEFSEIDTSEGNKLAMEGHTVFNLIENCKKPVIAAINGYALGGGLELAMACHIRIASESAKMGLPEVTLGLIPGYGGTQRLTRLVGKGRALEMILTADMIGARDAFQSGLINHVVPAEQLMVKAEELMQKIINNSPSAIAAAISAVNGAYDEKENGFKREINEFAKCFKTEDFKEGIKAFAEKRKPVFKGK